MSETQDRVARLSDLEALKVNIEQSLAGGSYVISDDVLEKIVTTTMTSTKSTWIYFGEFVPKYDGVVKLSVTGKASAVASGYSDRFVGITYDTDLISDNLNGTLQAYAAINGLSVGGSVSANDVSFTNISGIPFFTFGSTSNTTRSCVIPVKKGYPIKFIGNHSNGSNTMSVSNITVYGKVI